MTLDTRPTQRSDASETAGTIALVLGILFVISTALVFLMSLTDVIDGPNWLRALMSAGMPLGLLGVPLAYFVARTGNGCNRGRVGLALVGIALVPFVVLLFVMG